MKPPLIFKAKNDTIDFFAKDNLELSPWDDLSNKTQVTAFKLWSPVCWQNKSLCRGYELSKANGDSESMKQRCDGDIGWLMITPSHAMVCEFEKKEGRQAVALYSKGNTAARFNDDCESSQYLSNTFVSRL